MYKYLNVTLPLCVLQNLLIKPTLCELLTVVHQPEQFEILVWVHVACQYVFMHVHLR